MTAGVRPEFEERPGPALIDAAPIDPQTRDRLEREELQRRLAVAERERDTATERLQKLDIAYAKARRAWTLAKEVIGEQFELTTANLIRQGIETQVERELGAGPPEE